MRQSPKRLMWFAGLWLAGVLAVGVLALVIKLALPY
ncbi:DUF2474 family protein [Pseudooceanicola sp. HF7]|nr:DUF2474 family protein [Pseudooceanicola sp. HF7]NIZ10145.1 DUF2474 family protein [Pseudooceanicola sp. HF7]